MSFEVFQLFFRYCVYYILDHYYFFTPMSIKRGKNEGNAVLIVLLVGAIIVMIATGMLLSKKSKQRPQTQSPETTISNTPSNNNTDTLGTTDQKINNLDTQDSTVDQSLSVTPPYILGE